MPQLAAQGTKSDAITLKGSATMIAEFFRVGVNSILFQRGIYPCESFAREVAYNLPVLITMKDDLSNYILQFTSQLESWLVQKTIKKVVVAILNAATREPIERWQFNCECDKSANEGTRVTEKTIKEVQREMKDMMRQIISSVTLLPYIEDVCSFKILVYTDIDADTPMAWENGDDQFIVNSEQVKLKSLSTCIHKVDLAVSYKVAQT